MEEESLTLAKLAEQTSIEPRTIRSYIERGLLPGAQSRGRGAVYLAEHLNRLKVILQEALRMRWCGQGPTVKRLHGNYPAGVKLTRSQMKPYEARMERSKTLPKYDITINPQPDVRQVG